jgi:uncharacterized membrane protein YqjE
MQMPNSEQPGQPQGEPGPGLLDSAASMARNALGLLLTRLELAAIELGEIRGQVLKLALLGALFVLAAWFAVGWWSVLVVYLAWPVMGWKIIALMGLLFTGLAWFLMRKLLVLLRDNRLSMPMTMAELQNDRDALM